MASEVREAQQEIIDEFSLFDNWMDRYQYIIDLGRRLPPFPDELRTEEHRIRGCQSQVWFVARKKGDRLEFCAIFTADATRRISSTRRPTSSTRSGSTVT